MKKQQKQIPKRNKKQEKMGIVAVPIATAHKSRNSQPKIVRRSKDEIAVTHREYIADLNYISSNNDFAPQVKTLEVNPGLQLAFPWLSTLALSYESYRFEKLKYIFESSVATSTDGAFIMAFDYDASDSAPTTKQDFMNYEGAVKGPIWSATLEMILDAKRLNKLGPSRYTRGGVRPNTDIKTYDCGKLFYALINSPTTSFYYGDLFVEYTVILQTPQLTLERISDNCSQCVCTPGSTNATCFANATVTGSLPVTCSGDRVTFSAPGRYLVTTLLSNASGTSPSIGWNAGSGYVTISNPTNWLGSVGNANSTARTQFVDILQAPNFIVANNSGLAATNNLTMQIARFITS